MSEGQLKGRVAIVTGAGQGIGEAIAKAYAKEGAKVLLTGRTFSKVEAVVSSIMHAGGEARAIQAVSGDLGDAVRTLDDAIKAWGRVDILVNNAHSFTDYLPLEDPKMADHIRIDMESSLIGSLHLMQACFPHMRDNGGGSIINMGSSYGLRCEPGFLAYAASKEAVRALTRTAAREWGQHKIRVNTILPAAMSPKAIEYLEASNSYETELAKVALGKFGSADDIAPMAIFLASHASHYITGQTIGVDGGSTMF